jgi:hypothetical protein
MAIPLIFKRIAIIFIFQPQNEDVFGQTKKEDDYFLVTLSSWHP